MKVELLPITGLPEVLPGADLPELLLSAIGAMGEQLLSGDILVITQKIVSKAERREVSLADVQPSAFAQQWAHACGLDARAVELVLRESRRVVRMDRGVLITETHHGFTCANAGVDLSNVTLRDCATLLPVNPDASAQEVVRAAAQHAGVEIGVIVSDTFGRPWREGLTNVAIGVAGLKPLDSYVGARDEHGRELRATIHATADEIAAAAGLVSTKLNRVPAVIVRGLARHLGQGSAHELLRDPARDMFR